MGGAEQVRVGASLLIVRPLLDSDRTHTASQLFPTTAAESIVFTASDDFTKTSWGKSLPSILPLANLKT